ncbi:fad-dependent oxidoreductase [Cystobasidium minutum MCA 4210]|uniref:fad-dependent oxidoreductase n=1 Tax=Cystobasidium minutum MCA 4210 TaxID=1397322 RepID=UPI0034CFC3B2|eukprot:jgi/Rhomi1/167019/fgenesh1_kg.2_\
MAGKSVCIVGAGFSGIAAARVLDKFGYNVTLFEKAPDVGGVWSKIRRYPGVATQNTKDTYYLSEMPMPDDYPAWPSGQQVQAYLQSFCEKFNLLHRVRLCEEVIEATQDASRDNSWTIRTRQTNAQGKSLPDGKQNTYTFDVLLVCNGTFSDCFVPNYKGIDEFRAAGGTVCHTSEFLDIEEARGKDIIIVGYGKSACDCAVALSKVANTTTVVARKLIWKLPKFIAGLCYKFLFLGRVGENLFPYIRPGPIMRLLHGPLISVRNAMVGTVEWVVRRQLQLETSGALPPGHFEDVARASISLVTEDFFERMRSGDIVLKRDTEIEELIVEKPQPGSSEKPVLKAKLADGSVIPAQIVACGTGFYQRVPFLDQQFVNQHCTDEQGNFRMYRFIKPIETENLFFIGYNSSLFCPTSFEVATLWCISVMEGSLQLPSTQEQIKASQEELDWMKERTRGKHSKGTNVVPFSLHNIDEMLTDLHIGIGFVETARQWLTPC